MPRMLVVRLDRRGDRLCTAALIVGLAALGGCAQGGLGYRSAYGPSYGGYDGYGGYPVYGGSYDPYRHQDKFYPDPGIKCDRSVRICYDRDGANLALTDRYFNVKAADHLARKLPPGTPDDVFTPKQAVVCNSSEKICTDDGDPSAKKTRIYFGKKAAKQIDDDP